LTLRLHNIVGAASESLVAAYLASEGYEVYAPLSPHARADLAYRRNGRILGAQIKTASWQSADRFRYEQTRVSDRRTNTAYAPEEIDELWVVGTHLWRFPVEAIQGKTMLTLNSTNPGSRKSKRDYDPEDFIEIFGSMESPFRDRWKADDPEPQRLTTITTYAPSTLRKNGRRNGP
jgi:hypothetical protein